MARIKEITYEAGGLVALPNYENFRVHYGETVVLEASDDPKEVKRKLIARVEKFVEDKIAETKAEAESKGGKKKAK